MVKRYTLDRLVPSMCPKLPLKEALDVHLSGASLGSTVSGKDGPTAVCLQVLNATFLACILCNIVTMADAGYVVTPPRSVGVGGYRQTKRYNCSLSPRLVLFACLFMSLFSCSYYHFLIF